MLLEIQNQFRDLVMTHYVAGVIPNLEPGYKEMYATWEAMNRTILFKLSPEERTISFANYVRDGVRKVTKGVIDRGQLILASKDGLHFDTLLSPQEKIKGRDSDYYLLSPTFRSTTTKIDEVRGEQEILHVADQLTEQHFAVQRAWMEKNIVHVEVLHQVYGTYKVLVDVATDVKAALVYKFMNEHGTREVPETQLPEKFGRIEDDSTVQPVKALMAETVLMQGNNEENDKAIQAATAGALAGGVLALRNARQAEEAIALSALEESKRRPMGFGGRDISLPTVMASKARFARQDTHAQESQKREEERYKFAEEDSKKKEREEKKNKEKEAQVQQKQSKSSSQNTFAKRTAVGIGAAGGIFATLGGTTFLINHIIHLS